MNPWLTLIYISEPQFNSDYYQSISSLQPLKNNEWQKEKQTHVSHDNWLEDKDYLVWLMLASEWQQMRLKVKDTRNSWYESNGYMTTKSLFGSGIHHDWLMKTDNDLTNIMKMWCCESSTSYEQTQNWHVGCYAKGKINIKLRHSLFVASLVEELRPSSCHH